MKTLLKCENVSKKYGQFLALNNANLDIKSGRIIGLLGPNGSGKTTLIKLINGLLTPTSGALSINSVPISTETKTMVSYLPDRTYFSDWMKVKDAIDFFEDFYPDFNKSKAYDMLNRLSIKLNDKIKTMSKGTKEKVQLILVMSREADLYLLDEPIGGVDPAARDYILDTIITNYNSNASIIISTHLITDIERVLDDVIFIKDGNIVLFGDADEIREQNQKSIDELFREVFKC